MEGRLIFINVSVSNVPIYQMSMYQMPKTVIKIIDIARKKLFWQGDGTKKKYHLIQQDKICLPKKKGGLGIKILSKLNTFLLRKWWWRIKKGDGTWQSIVRKQYLYNTYVLAVKHKYSDSSCWVDLIKIKHVYLQGRKVLVGNGLNTRFWEDVWLTSNSLAKLFPTLYFICNQKGISVHECHNLHWNLNFRRWLTQDLESQWDLVLSWLVSVIVGNSDEVVSWSLDKRGIFSVKSTYNYLESQNPIEN